MKWEGNRLYVSKHEWAWSLRTCGFPVYAITKSGDIVKVGETTKYSMIYDLPENTIAVVRVYESNRGNRSLHIYLQNGSITIHESDFFNLPSELPETVKNAVVKLVEHIIRHGSTIPYVNS